MMNQFDGSHGNEQEGKSGPSVAWVKPTLNRLSLKEALTNVTGLNADGHTTVAFTFLS